MLMPENLLVSFCLFIYNEWDEFCLIHHTSKSMKTPDHEPVRTSKKNQHKNREVCFSLWYDFKMDFEGFVSIQGSDQRLNHSS